MTTTPIFRGVATALVTPLTENGVDYNQFGRLIDWQIDEGVNALVVCGTTGESSTLTDEEHREAIRFCVARTNGRIPVIAGTGSNDTAFAVKLSNEAEKVGADALLMVTPYYNKTSQRGLVRHYRYIHDRVSKPIVLYNVPSRTGVDIKPETYAELAEMPRVVAAKEANGNIAAFAKTMKLCGDKLDFYSGNADQITALCALGGKGVISVLSNVAPKVAHDIAMEAINGNVAESAKLQIEYIDLINALFSDVNPIPVKEAMNLMGKEVGDCRMPLDVMSDAGRESLKQVLIRYGLVQE